MDTAVELFKESLEVLSLEDLNDVKEITALIIANIKNKSQSAEYFGDTASMLAPQILDNFVIVGDKVYYHEDVVWCNHNDEFILHEDSVYIYGEWNDYYHIDDCTDEMLEHS